jgi:biopolymer transport protein ExbB
MIDSVIRTYQYLSHGGPVMLLISLASVVCLALVIERSVSLRRTKVMPEKLLTELEALSKEKKFSEVATLCRTSDTPLARVLSAGLAVSSKERAEIRETLELSGRREVSRLDKNLDLLGTLAAVGPLLGLLGTVTGMIRTFGVIRVIGVGDPLQLSGGIAEALLNTAGGLVVGIPALIAQRMFLRKVDGFILEMEEFAQMVLNLLKG